MLFTQLTAMLIFCSMQPNLQQLNVNVENTVLNVYSRSNTSATWTAQLKEYCAFLQMDECEFMRHIMAVSAANCGQDSEVLGV